MKKITVVREQRGGKTQVNVCIDGSLAFTPDTETSTGSSVKCARELSTGHCEEAGEASYLQGCFDAGLHYLSYRPRSEAEVRVRLRKRGFSDDMVSKVVSRLKERGLVDDAAFACFWRDNRLSFSPRSRRLIKSELRRKGVADDIVEEAIGGLDDECQAYEAGKKKARILAVLDYNEFYRRMFNHLKWRGFSYGDIDRAIARLWEEK